MQGNEELMGIADVSTLGLLLAAALSVTNVVGDIAHKKTLDRNNLVAATFWMRFLTACFITALLVARVYGGTPIVIRDNGALFGIQALHLAPVPTFLVYASIDTLGMALAILAYFRALQVSPLSLCVPFLAFTPIFLIPTGYLILGELPTWGKIVGIVMVVGGSLVMHKDAFAVSWWEPFRLLYTQKGSRYMLFAAFLYAVTNPVEKRLVLMSDAYVQSFAYSIGLMVLFAVLVVVQRVRIWEVWRTTPLWLVMAGLFDSLILVLQYSAIKYISVVITISIKRAGIVLAVLVGWLVFRERGIATKLIASSIMFAGVLVLYLPVTFAQACGVCVLTLVLAGIALRWTSTRRQSTEPAPESSLAAK